MGTKHCDNKPTVLYGSDVTLGVLSGDIGRAAVCNGESNMMNIMTFFYFTTKKAALLGHQSNCMHCRLKQQINNPKQ